MKISMWILADQLREYHPKCSIRSGECVLQAVRLFGNDDNRSPSTVYLCQITDMIETAKAGIMCVNQNDYIYFETLDVADVFNKIIRTFDYYRSWETELERLITDGKSIQDLITASSHIFRNPVIVGDAAYQIPAIDPNSEKFIKNKPLYQYLQKFGNLSIKDMNLVNQEQIKHLTRKSPYLIINENLPGTDGIVRNLFGHGKSRFGMMILKDEQGFTKGEIQLFDILGGFLEKWLKKNTSVTSVPALSQLFINLILQEDVDLNKYLPEEQVRVKLRGKLFQGTI